MTAPVISGPIGLTNRELLDAAMQNSTPKLGLDREIFEQVYPLNYGPHFKKFCRTGRLPLLVIAYCQSTLRGDKL